MKTSIIIACYNRWAFTKVCLDSLKNLSNDHEIILIDNASSDETAKEVSNYKIIYHRNIVNLFHSAACNQGFKLSNGKYIIFLNNDIKIKNNNWIDKIVEVCDKTNGLVGPTMGLLDKDFNFVKEANQQLEGNSYLGGWCIGSKREIWEKMKISKTDQVWNEKFPFYFNDTDLSFRAKKLGISLTQVNLPDIVHFSKISAQQINVGQLYRQGQYNFLKTWKK